MGCFLKAERDTWHGRGFGRGGGRGAGRSGWDSGRGPGHGRAQGPLSTGANRTPLGRGSGENIDWRNNALAFQEGKSNSGELDDTATSPVKDMDTDKGSLNDPAAKRKLVLDAKEKVVEVSPDHPEIVKPVDMVTDGSPPLGSSEPVDENDRNKWSKKDGANSSSLGSAGSLEGSVRSQ